jgi:cytochrome c oxidase subunit 2
MLALACNTASPIDDFRTIFALPPGASDSADDIDILHFFVIGTTLVGSVAIAIIAAVLITRYRQRRGVVTTEYVHVTAGREFVVISGLLSLFILWWLIGYGQYLRLITPETNAETIYVTGKQWMWKFAYADGRSSNDVLTVAVGRPVRLVMTSRDVIHSFYIPAFRTKQDVVPGRYVTMAFTPTREGSYPIYCAEYCGLSHSDMRGEVRVLSTVAYEQWLANPTREPANASLVEAGRSAAMRHGCFSCHTVDGQPHLGPTWSRLYASDVVLADGRHVRANEDYLTRSMMEPQADIVAGFKTIMPTYLGTLDSTDTAAIVEFIRSLRDGPLTPEVALPLLDIRPIGDGGMEGGGGYGEMTP